MTTGRRGIRRWPSRNFLEELEPSFRERATIEDLAHRDRTLRTLYRRLRELSKRIEDRIPTSEWIAFSDTRLAVQTTEFELAFNIGFENGLLAGRGESLHERRGTPSSEQETLLRLRLRGLLANELLHPSEAVAVLLEHAWALIRQPPQAEPAPGAVDQPFGARRRLDAKSGTPRVRPHLRRSSPAHTLSVSSKKRRSR